jgi:copper(I)-binding protein
LLQDGEIVKPRGKSEIAMNRSLYALTALVVLTACQKEQPLPAPAAELSVSDAVVRLPAVEGRPAAAYFTLHGGKTADRLEAVTSPGAATIELHESKMQGGMMKMSPLTGFDVPAGGQASFKPGGNHLMLFGIDPAVKPGNALPLQLTFQSGKTLDIEAKAIAAGEDMPTSAEHEGH